MIMADSNTVVLDNGSYSIKVGFAGNADSLCKYQTSDHVSDNNGAGTNWVETEKLWTYGIEEKLKMKPEERSKILVTRSPQQPNSDLQKMIKILFETMSFDRAYLATQPVLALYSSGAQTGLVVDIGHQQTNIVPVYYGYPVPEGNVTLKYAGSHLTDYLGQLLGNAHARSTVNAMKEKYCYVDGIYDDIDDVSKVTYTLPSGETISMKEERVRVPEALFNPTLLGFDKDQLALDTACKLSINNTDVDLHIPLGDNIQLAGGTSLLPHLAEQLQYRVSGNRVMKPKVKAHQYGEQAVWWGGSHLVLMSEFENLWLKKSEYEDQGAERMIAKLK